MRRKVMQQPVNESDADLSSGASAMLPKLVDEVFLFFARENVPDHHFAVVRFPHGGDAGGASCRLVDSIPAALAQGAGPV
jgi:hypothetical protein